MLVAVEILDECTDTAFVKKVMLKRLFMALVTQKDAHARVKERQFAIAVLKLLEIKLGYVLERL